MISACFDWRADTLSSGRVRVTAGGATAGFGETESIAKDKAVEATLRDIERDACEDSMSAEQKLDAVRRAAILAVHRCAG